MEVEQFKRILTMWGMEPSYMQLWYDSVVIAGSDENTIDSSHSNAFKKRPGAPLQDITNLQNRSASVEYTDIESARKQRRLEKPVNVLASNQRQQTESSSRSSK
jgi:hypothetical protein